MFRTYYGFFLLFWQPRANPSPLNSSLGLLDTICTKAPFDKTRGGGCLNANARLSRSLLSRVNFKEGCFILAVLRHAVAAVQIAATHPRENYGSPPLPEPDHACKRSGERGERSRAFLSQLTSERRTGFGLEVRRE